MSPIAQCYSMQPSKRNNGLCRLFFTKFPGNKLHPKITSLQDRICYYKWSCLALEASNVDAYKPWRPILPSRRKIQTSWGCSKFLPQHVRSQAARDVNVKNCSPGLVEIAKKCLITNKETTATKKSVKPIRYLQKLFLVLKQYLVISFQVCQVISHQTEIWLIDSFFHSAIRSKIAFLLVEGKYRGTK